MKRKIIATIFLLFLIWVYYNYRGAKVEIENSETASSTNEVIILKEILATSSQESGNTSAPSSTAVLEKTETTVQPTEIIFTSDNNAKYYKVVKVIDGDTIDVDIDGKISRIRMIGVNTPEVVDPRKPVECFGREASNKAKELLSGQEVRLKNDNPQDDKDKYDRLLRYVWLKNGLFYNLEIIKQGFAYEYTYDIPYEYQREFKDAQEYAQENKLGLWADGACGLENITSTATASSGACLIKGNISSSGDKIYHLPGCDYYKNTVIEESKGEKWFCSEDEAIKAGWRKAKNCN